MSTPSKRQRSVWKGDESADSADSDGGGSVDVDHPSTYSDLFGSENKEEKKRGQQSLQQLQSLSSIPSQLLPTPARDWFCANTALVKRVCVQRRPQDIVNWTTNFNSGLEGGMLEEECKRTCGHEIRSATLQYKIPGSEGKVQVPGINPGFLSSLVASMLLPQEIVPLITTSRANYVGNDLMQKERLALDTELMALANIRYRPFYANQKYHLQKILSILKDQERSVRRALSYPLLVNYLTSIYYASRASFWPLFEQLPQFEKFKVLSIISNQTPDEAGLEPAEMQKLMEQGLFEFKDDAIEQTNPRNSQLWEMRDGIFAQFFSEYRDRNLTARDADANSLLSEQLIDQFLALRHNEEVKTGGPILTKALLRWFRNLSSDVANGKDTERWLVSGRKWLRTFLERGYYGRTNYRYYTDNPLVSAIVLGDPVLIAEMTKELVTEEEGLIDVVGTLEEMRDLLAEDVERAEEDPQLKSTYASLLSIFDNLATIIPLSATTRAKLFPAEVEEEE